MANDNTRSPRLPVAPKAPADAAERDRREREQRYAKAIRGAPMEALGAWNVSIVFGWIDSILRAEREGMRAIMEKLRRIDTEAIRAEATCPASGGAVTPDDPKGIAAFKVAALAACDAVEAARKLAPPSTFKTHKPDRVDGAPLPHQFPGAVRRFLLAQGFKATGANVRDLMVKYGLEPVPADSPANELARKKWDEAGKSKSARPRRSRVVSGRRRPK